MSTDSGNLLKLPSPITQLMNVCIDRDVTNISEQVYCLLAVSSLGTW